MSNDSPVPRNKRIEEIEKEIEELKEERSHDCFAVKGDPDGVCNTCLKIRKLQQKRDEIQLNLLEDSGEHESANPGVSNCELADLPVAAKVSEIYYKDEDHYDFPHINIAINEDMRREFEEGDEFVKKVDAEEAVRDREEQVRQRILDTLRMMRDNFQHRVDVAVEEKEDAEGDSWNEKRSIERINCYDLAQRKIQELCEHLESSGQGGSTQGEGEGEQA